MYPAKSVFLDNNYSENLPIGYHILDSNQFCIMYRWFTSLKIVQCHYENWFEGTVS